jgi:hypothetical protein
VIYLERKYSDETNFEMAVLGVRSNSPLCKTQSGIGIGTDKLKIVTTYENYSISLWPEYDDDAYTIKSKTRSVAQVMNDDYDSMILFHLVNKKVVGFEVSYAYGD